MKDTTRNTKEILVDMEENVKNYNAFYSAVSKGETPKDENGERLDGAALEVNRVKLNTEYLNASAREHYQSILMRTKNNVKCAMIEFAKNPTFSIKVISDDKKATVKTAIINDKTSTSTIEGFISEGKSIGINLPVGEWKIKCNAYLYGLTAQLAKKLGADISNYSVLDEERKEAKTAREKLLKSIVADLIGEIYADKITSHDIEMLNATFSSAGKTLLSVNVSKERKFYRQFLAIIHRITTDGKYKIEGYKTR